MSDKEYSYKDKTAIALSYEVDEKAPKVIATGKGYLAEKIIKGANDGDIPIHEDEKLANSLSKLELGAYIPTELYDIVAEILLFVDQMDKIKHKIDPDRY